MNINVIIESIYSCLMMSESMFGDEAVGKVADAKSWCQISVRLPNIPLPVYVYIRLVGREYR